MLALHVLTKTGTERRLVAGSDTFPVETGGLLALSGPFRRTVRRIAAPPGWLLRLLFDLVTKLVLVSMGCLFLMCGMLMVVGLKMFGLVLRAFAVFGHEFSNIWGRAGGSERAFVALLCGGS
ncbi:MAG TPA: hypothetical protein VH020_08855 [Stellaceae bacterium]|nr:hypothetical protein [Stellaceae bacterium]